MTTPTLERPAAVPQPGHGDSNNDDGLAHRFKHDDIERSLASGMEVTALCGYRKRLTRHNPTLPVCPACANLYELAESIS